MKSLELRRLTRKLKNGTCLSISEQRALLDTVQEAAELVTVYRDAISEWRAAMKNVVRAISPDSDNQYADDIEDDYLLLTAKEVEQCHSSLKAEYRQLMERSKAALTRRDEKIRVLEPLEADIASARQLNEHRADEVVKVVEKLKLERERRIETEDEMSVLRREVFLLRDNRRLIDRVERLQVKRGREAKEITKKLVPSEDVAGVVSRGGGQPF